MSDLLQPNSDLLSAQRDDVFVRRVHRYAEAHDLMPLLARPLVALSGGPDSVALLRVLLALGRPVAAAHCHFGLRGAESDADETFVRRLCQERSVELHVQHFDTARLARQHGVSIEMEARELRYAFFQTLMQAHGYTATAVGHHRDDNVETLLLHLVRGSGLRGLTGMAPRRNSVVRPLLGVSRTDVLAYLKRLHQPYRTDSSNLVADVQRNIVRLDVLPGLRVLNPSVDDTLDATIGRLTEAQRLYELGLEALEGRVVVSRGAEGLDLLTPALYASGCAGTLLHHVLSPYGFSPATLQQLAAEAPRQGALFEQGEWQLWSERGRLLLRKRPVAQPPVAVPIGGTATLANGRRISAMVQPGAVILRSNSVACLDAAAIDGRTLTLRPTRNADRFVPLGMRRGSKLISDFLTDRKATRYDKATALVLCAGADIAWLVGQRPDARFAVGPSTRHTLVVRLEQPDSPSDISLSSHD